MFFESKSANWLCILVPASLMVISGLVLFDVINLERHRKSLDDVLLKGTRHVRKMKRRIKNNSNDLLSDIS